MFSLNDILQSAQGGQAMENLARQFGISPDQARAAVDALAPALSMGFQQKASQPGGLGDILAPMASGDHAAAYEDAAAAADPSVVDQGNDVLGQIFGSKGVSRDVASHAAAVSGVPSAILKQMLPVIAAMLMGGMFKSMNNQGLGGILGQLAGALTGQGQPPAQAPTANPGGGLGDVLGQVFGGAPQGRQGAPGGGLGDILGGVLGQMMGAPGSTPAPRGQAAAPSGGLEDVLGQVFGAPSGSRGGIDPNLAKAGLEALGKMFQPGPQAGAAQQSGLQDIFSQMFGGKR